MRLLFVILLLANCANSSMGQTTRLVELPTVSGKTEPSGDVADKQHRLHDELQKQLAARDTLNGEIERLRELTGQSEQIVVYVTVSELSLTKVRESNVIVNGVNAELLKRSGIGGVLDANLLDERDETERLDASKRGSKTIGFRVIDNVDLLSELTTALKESGAFKVLAEPTLATISGRLASFHSGGEFPNLVPQANGESTTQYKKFGTQVDCLPLVIGSGRIRLEVRTSVSEIDGDRSIVVSDVTVPGLRVRMVDTAVEMNVGQTLVLAGLLQERVSKTGGIASEPAKAAPERKGEVLDPSQQTEAEPDVNPIEEVELVVTLRTEFVGASKVAPE